MADYSELIAELESRGFEFIPRQRWQDANNPVRGPSFNRGAVVTSYVHWPGAKSLGSDVAQWMRQVDNERRSKPKPYSFPYNFVFRDRQVWEGRGWAFRNAANKGSKVDGNANGWSQSLLIYRAIGEGASDTECEAAAVVSHMAGPLAEQPHSTVESTDCPGDGIRAQIQLGKFDLDTWRSTVGSFEPDPGEPSRAPSAPTPEPGAPFDWTALTMTDRRIAVMQILTRRYGFSDNAAAGIVGNLEAESGIIPSRVQGSRGNTPLTAPDNQGNMVTFTPEAIMNRVRGQTGPKAGGIGLAQWTFRTRRDGLFRYSYKGAPGGPHILFDMDAQLDYLVHELQVVPEFLTRVNSVLRRPDVTVDEASDVFLFEFERPADMGDAQRDKRRAFSQQALADFIADPDRSIPGRAVATRDAAEPVPTIDFEPDESDLTEKAEEEEIVISYIARPPQDAAHEGKPWMVCINGNVRYATNRDVQAGLELYDLDAGQYAWLLRSAGLD